MLSTKFENILEKYEKQKFNTYRVVEILGDDYTFTDFGSDTTDKRYRALVECGTQLHFQKNMEQGSYVYHLVGANFCRQRLCPMCQFRNAERMYAKMIKVIKHLESGYRFIHLVLTIPNSRDGSELIDGIKVLYKAYNMLMHRKKVIKAFKGSLRCLEISYNYDNDTFHPHLHCLIAVKPSYFNDSRVYMSRDEIAELWTSCVNKSVKSFKFTEYIKTDTVYQTFVRACKPGDYEGVAEVCKYCLKPLDLHDKGKDEQHKRVLLTLWHTLKGQRFVQKYGVIKDTFKLLFGDDDEDDEELEELDNSNKLFLLWNSEIQKYCEGV